MFGSVKLTNHSDPDKYKYTGYVIGFGSRSDFSFTDWSYGENVIIFGADMRSSLYAKNKGKYILILHEGPTQGSDNTTLIAQTKYLLILHNQEKDLY